MKVNDAVFTPLLSAKPVVVHQGGTSSGKTYGIMQYLLMCGLWNANEVITVVAEDIPNLKAGAYRDAQNIIADDPNLQKWYPRELHNKTDRIIKSRSGTVLEFRSYQDTYDARSGKRDRLFINEANGVAYEIYEQLSLRTTKQTVIDYNPSAPFWAHEHLFGREGVQWVITTYRDNAFLNDNIRRKIESYEPTPENIERGTANQYRWQVYGLGQVGRLEGLVFPDFKVTTQWPEQYKWRVWGLDFGFTNDPTALVEIRYAHGNLYWKEHIYETSMTNTDIVRRLVSREHPRNELIVADSAEPKSIKEISDGGFYIHPSVKGADSINNGIDAIKRYNVYITADSKNLIEEFSSYTWKLDRNGKPMNVPIDAFNHGIDAGRYALSKRLLEQGKPLQAVLVDF